MESDTIRTYMEVLLLLAAHARENSMESDTIRTYMEVLLFCHCSCSWKLPWKATPSGLTWKFCCFSLLMLAKIPWKTPPSGLTWKFCSFSLLMLVKTSMESATIRTYMEVLLFLAAHACENSHVKRQLRELRGSVSFLMQYIFGRFCISSRSLYSFRLYKALVFHIMRASS